MDGGNDEKGKRRIEFLLAYVRPVPDAMSHRSEWDTFLEESLGRSGAMHPTQR